MPRGRCSWSPQRQLCLSLVMLGLRSRERPAGVSVPGGFALTPWGSLRRARTPGDSRSRAGHRAWLCTWQDVCCQPGFWALGFLPLPASHTASGNAPFSVLRSLCSLSSQPGYIFCPQSLHCFYFICIFFARNYTVTVICFSAVQHLLSAEGGGGPG